MLIQCCIKKICSSVTMLFLFTANLQDLSPHLSLTLCLKIANLHDKPNQNSIYSIHFSLYVSLHFRFKYGIFASLHFCESWMLRLVFEGLYVRSSSSSIGLQKDPFSNKIAWLILFTFSVFGLNLDSWPAGSEIFFFFWLYLTVWLHFIHQVTEW